MRTSPALVIALLLASQPAMACEIKPFLAYFNAEGSGSPEVEMVLDETVRFWRTLPSDQKSVIVQGHTDTIGDANDNQARSMAMARRVRDGLLARGVPVGVVVVEAHGETKPVIATGDNVAEALNRRVEIHLDYVHDCFPGSHIPPDPKAP